MEKRNIFLSEHLQMTEVIPEEDSKKDAVWSLDVRYARFRRRDPIRPVSATESKKKLDELLKEMDESRNCFYYALRTRGDDSELVGFLQIDDIEWTNGQGFLALFFGKQELTEQYYSEGLQIALKYAMHELNLEHVIVELPAFYKMEIDYLEKAGMQIEACLREMAYHQGRHYDQLEYGILAEEWREEA